MRIRLSILVAALALPAGALAGRAATRIPLESGWRLQFGDEPSWALPEIDDRRWRTIDASQPWELQGFAAYNGYAWYRAHVTIPSSLKKESLLQDEIQIALGLVDDSDQVFLNGSLIGQNGVSVAPGTLPNEAFEGGHDTYRRRRVYRLSAHDPRIRWDEENVIAVRVHDHGGAGGLYGGPRFVGMVDLDDVIILDVDSAPFEIRPDDRYRKTLRVRNDTSTHDFEGELRVTAEPLLPGPAHPSGLVDVSQPILLRSGETRSLPFEMRIPRRVPHVARYTFVERSSGRSLTSTQEVPYILTPTPPASPRLNGPHVLGARPGSPVTFRIPASGERPMAFATRNLPAGLSLDPEEGVIRGAISSRGRYPVTVEARNIFGSDTRILDIIVGDSSALTPPLGWSSWRQSGLDVSDKTIRDAADLLVSTGLADHGWAYLTIDDGWQAEARTPEGELPSKPELPDVGALAEALHRRGLRLGLFSSPGPRTCGGRSGAFGHERTDARRWADWGIDLLEYGWCSYGETVSDQRVETLKRPYLLMGSILEGIERDIIFSISQYGWAEVWKWADDARAQIWHTDADSGDTWADVLENGFMADTPVSAVRPGYWRDPGLLAVGWLSWGKEPRPSQLTVSEQYAQVSLWSLMAAPLTLSCDLSRMDAFALSLLTNDEVLAINQDPLGRHARRMIATEGRQVWLKPLADGSRAVGIFNLSSRASQLELGWDEVGINARTPLKARDVWRQRDVMTTAKGIVSVIPPHGVALLRVTEAGE